MILKREMISFLAGRKNHKERTETMFLSRLFAVSMAVLLSVWAALPVFAADVNIDYEGELDLITGKPVTEEKTADNQTITMMTGVSYDRKMHKYLYSVPNSTETVSCSVADGMVTTGNVLLSVPSGIRAELYKNGVKYGEEENKKEDEEDDSSEEEKKQEIDLSSLTIKEAGAYSLVLSTADSKRQFLTFSIVKEKTGAMKVFQVPDGFTLINVSINEENQRFSVGANTVDMSREGDYVISYRCETIGVNNSFAVTVDHTPPQVTFEGINNGVAKNPVAIAGVEKSDTVEVLRDGHEMKISKDNIIRSPGKYIVTVTDDAENSVTEEFEIKFYLNEQGWVFAAIIIFVIAAGVTYMIVSKKRLRVR